MSSEFLGKVIIASSIFGENIIADAGTLDEDIVLENILNENYIFKSIRPYPKKHGKSILAKRGYGILERLAYNDFNEVDVYLNK